MGSRLLGVGLAAGLAAVTVVLWLNGQLALYINPSSNWFAVPMAIIALVGAVISFALPEGAESDHGTITTTATSAAAAGAPPRP